MSDVELGLNTMRENEWSLVTFDGGAWYFAECDGKQITNADVLRMGFWRTPQEALAELGQRERQK